VPIRSPSVSPFDVSLPLYSRGSDMLPLSLGKVPAMSRGLSLSDVERLELPSPERRLALDFLHLFRSEEEPLQQEDLEDWMLLNGLSKARVMAAVQYAIREGWVADSPLRITAEGLMRCE
jgi:hypothetical protein